MLYIERKLHYLYFRPSGLAFSFFIFGLPVLYHSAFRIRPNGPTLFFSVNLYFDEYLPILMKMGVPGSLTIALFASPRRSTQIEFEVLPVLLVLYLAVLWVNYENLVII